MKVLLIGMDGGHLDAYRRGWTPVIERLMTSGSQALIREDLVGRGWTKVITGECASVTGATYDRPALDGTKSWSLKFKLEDIPGIGGNVKTLWEKINDNGHKVGIMNVPTAFPAPEVNGFFVSGGGGGSSVLQDPVEELCYPSETLDYLLEIGYIVDERLNTLIADKGLIDDYAFFDRLAEKNRKRTRAFIDLSRKHNVDFGFVVYKSSSNLAEFLLLPELEAAKHEGRSVPSDLQLAICEYYREFDKQVLALKEAFPDSEIIFVSDHGMVARKWSFNPNKLLQEMGFQVASRVGHGKLQLISFAKRLVPYWVRLAVRNLSSVKRAYESLVVFDNVQSKAFSMIIGDWRHGIWINDDARFGGPVPSSQIELVTSDIVAALSSHDGLREYGINVVRRPNPGASEHFPDIILEVPDGFISTNETSQIFERFEMPKGPHTIATVTQGQLLCGKSSQALAVLSADEGWNAGDVASDDLSIVHHHILSRFPPS